jgi:hypothetical protein
MEEIMYVAVGTMQVRAVLKVLRKPDINDRLRILPGMIVYGDEDGTLAQASAVIFSSRHYDEVDVPEFGKMPLFGIRTEKHKIRKPSKKRLAQQNRT